MKWLVCRNDRLGDTLLSLPALKWLRDNYPEVDITLLSQKSSISVFSHWLASNHIEGLSDEGGVSDYQFDAVLFLFYDSKLASQMKAAKIPIRIGAYSKLLSFFNLTGGLFQKRSSGKKNEAEFGLDLARYFASVATNQQSPPSHPNPILLATADSLEKARIELSKRGIDSRRFVVLHPGMGGSALNLSAARYSELIKTIEEKANPDLWISIGPGHEDQRLKNELTSRRTGLKFLEGVPIDLLGPVFSLARLVIAPSTGPLHLAHFYGTPTIGIFSPVRSQKAKRWSPWGGAGRSFTLTPEVICPAKRTCLGEKCSAFNCFEKFEWEQSLLPLVKKALSSSFEV